MDKNTLGSFIANTRRSLDMTQQALAEKLHVTGAAVSKWERGLSYPDLTMLQPLADALEISVSQLMACEKEPQDPATQQEDAMRSVIQIAETSHKKQRRKVWVFAICTLLALALLCTYIVVTARGNRLSTLEAFGPHRFYAKEVRGDGFYVYVEHDDHLIQLKCPDEETYQQIAADFDQVYDVSFRYDTHTCKGTLSYAEYLDYDWMSPMDVEDASVGIENLFGVRCVWMEYVEVYPDTGREGGYLYALRFYYRGDGWDYYTFENDRPETTLLYIPECRAANPIDYDGDGAVELVVKTKYPEYPYIVYDKIDGQIVSKIINTSELPDEYLALYQNRLP